MSGVTSYYFSNYDRRMPDNRLGGHTLWRGKVTRPPWPDLPATIYEYNR